MSEPLIRDGDEVLVKGTIADRMVCFGKGCLPLRDVEIDSVVKTMLSVGDRVVAGHHSGVILAVCGGQVWVQPDSGNRRPWTVDSDMCLREPPPPPSAEVHPFKSHIVRPCDSEDTAA